VVRIGQMHVRVDGAGDHIGAPGADLAPAAQAVADGRDPLAVDADTAANVSCGVSWPFLMTRS
jgi:hypothetical protein